MLTLLQAAVAAAGIAKLGAAIGAGLSTIGAVGCQILRWV